MPIQTIEDLTPDPRNARRHTPRNIGVIERSLNEVGAARSIVIDEDGVILAGNATTEAAMQAGITRVRVIEADGNELIAVQRRGLTPEQKVKLALADNRAAELAEWEPDVLAEIAAEMDVSGLFRADELAELAMLTEPEAGAGGDEFDPTPDDGPTRAQPGDLWVIGGVHRLLVGDCTDPANVARLMGGERAKLTMTSPPYWVGKDYEQEQTWAEIQAFIQRCATVMAENTTHRIVINTGAPQAGRLTGKRAHIRLLLDDWQRELEQYGYLMRYVRIWTKRGGLLHTRPESDCIDQHWEFIATFYDPNNYEGQRRCGEPWATEGLWEMHGEMSSGGHTAAFPVEIPRRNIILHTDPGDLIYEPFMGSGVTMIAAHREGRRCYGCDVTPKYADLCLARAEAEGLTVERAETPYTR